MEKNTLSRESLNLLIRRMDGRFLSSNPYPKKSICFAKGALSDAVDLISESVVHPASTVSDCELAVAVDPDHKTLQAASSSLKPGGTCYIEWNVTQLVNLKNIRNKLEASGFDDIALYIPKPPPNIASAKTWIPLKSKNAIEFWSKIEYNQPLENNAKYINYFLKRSFVKIFSGLFNTFPGLLYPRIKSFIICSIAHKPILNTDKQIPSNRKTHSENKGKDFHSYSIEPDKSILKSSDSYFQSQHSSILMMTEGSFLQNNVILFVFADDKSEPTYLVKMSRLANFSKTLINEANTLSHLETTTKDINIIPKLLFYENLNGYSYIGETYIKGKTFNKILTNNNFRELSMRATKLLVEFDTATRKKAPNNWKDKLIKPILTKFLTSYGPILTPDLIKKASSLLNEIELTHTVCTHGDYSQGNILMKSDGELALIDFEHSIIHGFPVIDIIYFLALFSFDLKSAWEGNNYLSCYRDLMNETTDIGRVYKECLHYYCEQVGIQKSMIPKYRLLLWTMFLNRKYDELNLSENFTPTEKSLRDVLHIDLWIEEITRLSYSQSKIKYS